MPSLRYDDQAGNLVQVVEETISDCDYDFRVLTSWIRDDIPRIAYRTQKTTDQTVWEEAAQLVGVLVHAYSLDDEVAYDLAPERVICVTLPHIDSSSEAAAPWLVRREWITGYNDETISQQELLQRISDTRAHVGERELLKAADGEDSLDWEGELK